MNRTEFEGLSREDKAAYRAELFRRHIESMPGGVEAFVASIPKTQEEWDALPDVFDELERRLDERRLARPGDTAR